MMNNLFVDSPYINNLFDKSSVILASLLHDLGKAGYRGKPNYVPNILKSGKLSETKPYETNKDRLYISHEIVSLVVAAQYIELTDEEEFAIMYHNGLYVASGRDIQGKERPLQQLLHFCDMWCSRFVETEKEEI
jgi:23S rRNA maturation-related 3'-5' exoribonuclease YhaM